MSAPPVPPRPYELSSNSSSHIQNPGPPPPLPPLPPEILRQAEKYDTPSQYEYESPPHFERPMIAPRPHRVDKSIPVNMARTLDEQLSQSQPSTNEINYNPGFMVLSRPPQQISQSQQGQQHATWVGSPQPVSDTDLHASIASLSLQSSVPLTTTSNSNMATSIIPPPPPPTIQGAQTYYAPGPSSPPRLAAQPSTSTSTSTSSSTTSQPSLTAPLPSLVHLAGALPTILATSPAHPPHLTIAWVRDIFFLLHRAQGAPTDPPVGPLSSSHSSRVDPELARLAEEAVGVVLSLASSWSPPPSSQGKKVDMPPHVAEAIAYRAHLAATGLFPARVPHNPRVAFRDYEAAARGGYGAAWFRLGRDYENFGDEKRARECFERGAKMGVESCVYRLGMAHLLGQLALPASPATALPLLHRAALLSSLHTPQPAYVYALLLLSEFTLLPAPLPPSLLSSLVSLPPSSGPLIPVGSSPTLEARKHLERAAYLHFPAAQYKLGHAYEFAEAPFGFDPVLSVQYYSLASESGAEGMEEADMALSKWFLCGSGGAGLAHGSDTVGGFEKDESLALLFAEKAARKGLPSAEFAMGYYAEVGVGQVRDVNKAIGWYELAKSHGNPDAPGRLLALTSSSTPHTLTRAEHAQITEQKLIRRRTMAARRAEEEPVSPPWEGKVFPSMASAGVGGEQQFGQQQQQLPGGIQQGQGQKRPDGRAVVDLIRKNSMAHAENSQSQGGVGTISSIPVGGRLPPSHSSSLSASGSYSQGYPGTQPQGYGGRDASPARGRYDSSVGMGVNSQHGRMASPGRRTQSPGAARRAQSPARLPIGGGSVPANAPSTNSGSPGRPAQAQGLGGQAGQGQAQAGQTQMQSKLERMRLNNLPNSNSNTGYAGGFDDLRSATGTSAGIGNSPYPPFSASASNSNPNLGRYTGGSGSGRNTPSHSHGQPQSQSSPQSQAQQSRPLAQGQSQKPQATHRPSASTINSVGDGNGGGKRPQTFAEMGIHGAKVEDKDCRIM
ncbi:Chitin synthase regulatory factor 4 [Psilocybe cubensis]|uniref:HCP-like protein n=2 Tax=Psilocybe cubensis TaxID=181762 RepID=A0A8H7XZM8_PSICU|nr:Chitin synthase regulatory factor 4 [Psilocybe cubensis]KAH9478962.1 Chitin synthase regulatory factor 4 [Psilocybe cubensis]